MRRAAALVLTVVARLFLGGAIICAYVGILVGSLIPEET